MSNDESKSGDSNYFFFEVSYQSRVPSPSCRLASSHLIVPIVKSYIESDALSND